MDKKLNDILIASGGFKGVYSPVETCSIIKNIIEEISDESKNIDTQPMTDGGEYVFDLLHRSLDDSVVRKVHVVDVAGKPTVSEYLLMDSDTAFIATSRVLALHPSCKESYRNPLLLTSYGLGQIINHIIECNIKKIIIGLGGTSTADAGIGMLQALGATFVGRDNKVLSPQNKMYFSGSDLANIYNITFMNKTKFANLQIKTLCDATASLNEIKTPTALKVSNSYKDRPDIIEKIVGSILSFSKTIYEKEGMKQKFDTWSEEVDLLDKKYFGVAGGVLLGMIFLFKVKPMLGIDYFINLFNLAEKINNADLIITAEGRLDNTLSGKTPYGIATLAKKYNKNLIYICGSVSEELKPLFDKCINTKMPKEFYESGIKTVICCYPEYDKDLNRLTFEEELNYYKQQTPLILRKLLKQFYYDYCVNKKL